METAIQTEFLMIEKSIKNILIGFIEKTMFHNPELTIRIEETGDNLFLSHEGICVTKDDGRTGFIYDEPSVSLLSIARKISET